MRSAGTTGTGRDALDPWLRPVAEHDRDRHVGGLTGRRGRGRRRSRGGRRRRRARGRRARPAPRPALRAGACNSRRGGTAARRRRTRSRDRRADRVCGREDAVDADEAGRRVAIVVRDPDVEIAGVRPAEPAQAGRPHRGGRQLGAVRLRTPQPDRVDRDADDREGHGGGRTLSAAPGSGSGCPPGRGRRNPGPPTAGRSAPARCRCRWPGAARTCRRGRVSPG